MSITAAGAAVPVTGISSWDFDGTTDKVDVTGQGDPNKLQALGLANAGGSFSFFWDDADDTLFDAAESGEAVNMYLYKDVVNAATVYRYGSAWVDIQESTSVSGAVEGSGTFVAAGAWARKP